jgi:hypothetical protein
MKLVLTNAGHRKAIAVAQPNAESAGTSTLSDTLLRLCASYYALWQDDHEQRSLIAQGYAELVPDSVSTTDMVLRMHRNPIENINTAVIEFTTHCNFSCPHCYNAGVARHTEKDLESLLSATDTLSDLGVREFVFIGGEVSKYGDGWLEVSKQIKARGARVVGLLSNGWFLGKQDFLAGGKKYRDVPSYLSDLREHGITHLAFSIDGRGETHDRSRGVPGLYDRILVGLRLVRDSGIQPRVSILSRDESATQDIFREMLERTGSTIFDPTNIVSNFIDLSGLTENSSSDIDIKTVGAGSLRCAGFYRPAPDITLKANGEVATCRLADAGEGYGNFHDRPLIKILNSLQESFVYRLHADRRISTYLKFLDPNVFGSSFNHLCALRAILTMIARRMNEQGVEADDAKAIHRINREVALVAGRAVASCEHG